MIQEAFEFKDKNALAIDSSPGLAQRFAKF
jgi:hypothetical protein